MKFIMHYTEADKEFHFRGSFSADELADLKLSPVERAMLAQPLDGNPASDYLLALETIYRRHEERK